MGQITGATIQVCDGFDTPYCLSNGTQGVFHAADGPPAAGQVDAFIAGLEADANQEATIAQKAAASAAINQAAADAVAGQYPQFIQQGFQMMLTTALAQGLVNRAAYIGQLVEWVMSVIQAATVCQQQIAAASTLSEINAVALDSAGLIGTDPQVSLPAALAITN